MNQSSSSPRRRPTQEENPPLPEGIAAELGDSFVPIDPPYGRDAVADDEAAANERADAASPLPRRDRPFSPMPFSAGGAAPPLERSSAASAPTHSRAERDTSAPPFSRGSSVLPTRPLSSGRGAPGTFLSTTDPDSPAASAIFDVAPDLSHATLFEIHRLEPAYYKSLPIAGFWRRVEPPFSIVDLQSRAGGGLYRVTRLEGGRRVAEAHVRIGVVPPRVDDFPGASREDLASGDGGGAVSMARHVELAVARALGARESESRARSAEDELAGSIERAEKIVNLFDRLRGKNERGGSFLRDIPDYFWKQAAGALQSAVTFFSGKGQPPRGEIRASAPSRPEDTPRATAGEGAPAALPDVGAPRGPAVPDYAALERVVREAAASILSHVERGSPKLEDEAERLLDSVPGLETFIVPGNRGLISQFILRAIGETIARDETEKPGSRTPSELTSLEARLPEAVSFFVEEALDYARAPEADEDDGGASLEDDDVDEDEASE